MSESRLVYSTDGTHRVDARERTAQRSGPGRPSKAPGQPPNDGYVRVAREKAGRRGKEVTVIRGLPGNQEALNAIATELKRACGVGGFARDGVVEIQGDQRERVVPLLAGRGFKVKLAGG